MEKDLCSDALMIEPLAIGLLGAGEWGPNLLRAFRDRDDCRVLWVCDRDRSRLDWVRPRFPEVEALEDYHAALLRSDTQAVAICTPTESHFRLCREALAAGKHVFVEKPMACSYAEAKVLVDLAARMQRKLMVGHVFLFHPGIQTVHRLLTEGALGRPLYYSSERSHFGPVREDVSVLWDLAPHDLSVLSLFFPEPPTQAKAHGLSLLPGGAVDTAWMELRWDSGLVAHARMSWIDPRKVRRTMILGTRRAVVFEETAGEFSVRLFAPSGVVDPSPLGLMAYREAFRGPGETVAVEHGDEPVGVDCAAFVNWIRQGVPQFSGGDLGAEVVYLIERLQSSMAREGEAMDLSSPRLGGRA